MLILQNQIYKPVVVVFNAFPRMLCVKHFPPMVTVGELDVLRDPDLKWESRLIDNF